MNGRGRRVHPRGQAIYETAIMMPLFLIGLFGTFWAVRESALSERMQEGIRYGGLVSAETNPYTAYSLYAMYSVLDGGTLPLGTTSCTVDLGPSITAVRTSFWEPVSTPVSVCKPSTSLVAATTQNILLQDIYLKATSSAPVDGYVSGSAFGGAKTTPVSASQNYFRSPDVGTLMSCTSIGNDVKLSLEGGADVTTPTGAPTLFPLLPGSSSVFAAPLTCATFPAAPAQPTFTPLPTPTPTLSPTPTPTPTVKPSATPYVPTPTPTAYVPTPTPVPTASPTPSPTPITCYNVLHVIVICPTATPAPTATPTTAATATAKPATSSPAPPTATPTVAPTPTATPNPYGTPPGGLTG